MSASEISADISTNLASLYQARLDEVKTCYHSAVIRLLSKELSKLGYDYVSHENDVTVGGSGFGEWGLAKYVKGSLRLTVNYLGEGFIHGNLSFRGENEDLFQERGNEDPVSVRAFLELLLKKEAQCLKSRLAV